MSKCKCRNCEGGKVVRITSFAEKINCPLCKGQGRVEWIDNVAKPSKPIDKDYKIDYNSGSEASLVLGQMYIDSLAQSTNNSGPREALHLVERHLRDMQQFFRHYGFEIDVRVQAHEDHYYNDYYNSSRVRGREVFSIDSRNDRNRMHSYNDYVSEGVMARPSSYADPSFKIGPIKIKKEKI